MSLDPWIAEDSTAAVEFIVEILTARGTPQSRAYAMARGLLKKYDPYQLLDAFSKARKARGDPYAYALGVLRNARPAEPEGERETDPWGCPKGKPVEPW